MNSVGAYSGAPGPRTKRDSVELAPGEIEAIEHLCSGKTKGEAANACCISTQAFWRRLQSAMDRLGAATDYELIAIYCKRSKLQQEKREP
jgi:predicted DNA-binding protein (UPF0251 family)